jgi:general secretion pathway protein A
MGKTTLLYELLDELRDSAQTGFLFQTQCNSHEFLGYLLNQLGVDARGMGPVVMHNKLNMILRDGMSKGRRFVMIVDEAQNLDESVLETVRLLSNLETPRSKLLQIILSGQPSLTQKLAQSPLVQLRERIAVLTHLQVLSPEETAGYIEHRLKIAGRQGEPLFAADALALIIHWSRGVPRKINTICFEALSLGHARRCPRIDSRIVIEAAVRLDIESIQPEMKLAAVNQVGTPSSRAGQTPTLGTKRLQKTNGSARAGLRNIS